MHPISTPNPATGCAGSPAPRGAMAPHATAPAAGTGPRPAMSGARSPAGTGARSTAGIGADARSAAGIGIGAPSSAGIGAGAGAGAPAPGATSRSWLTGAPDVGGRPSLELARPMGIDLHTPGASPRVGTLTEVHAHVAAARSQAQATPWGMPQEVSAQVIRGRLLALAGYAVANAALIAATSATTSATTSACLGANLTAYAGLLVGCGLGLPMAALVLTRVLPPRWPLAKHAALVALNIGMGVGLTAAGAWGASVLASAVCGLALVAVGLAVVAYFRLDGCLGPQLARGLEEGALTGLAFGPAMAALLPPGIVATAVHAAIWTLGFGFVCLLFLDRVRMLSAEVRGAQPFDVVNASIGLYTPLLSLLFNLCRAGAALPAWRPRLA